MWTYFAARHEMSLMLSWDKNKKQKRLKSLAISLLNQIKMNQ